MAHSIEARVPFLDHRLVEFAFRLPGDYKVHGVETKYVLREALKGVLPERIRTRTRQDRLPRRAGGDLGARRAQPRGAARARTPYEERWFDRGAARRPVRGKRRAADGGVHALAGDQPQALAARLLGRRRPARLSRPAPG